MCRSTGRNGISSHLLNPVDEDCQAIFTRQEYGMDPENPPDIDALMVLVRILADHDSR